MALFRKSSTPTFDRAEGNPHVANGLRFLRERNWAALSEVYEGLAPSDRFHLIQGLGELSDVDAEMPLEVDDIRAAVIIGGIRVGWAWRHRGSARGNEVTQIGADGMRRCLMAADAMLEAAGQQDPNDSTIIAWHLRCEMGLGGDYGHLTRLVGRLGRSSEANIFAALAHLNFVAPKWYGSVDEMWTVANSYASAPHNAAWVALAARAHVEEWLYCFSFGDDRNLQVAYSNKMNDPGFRAFIASIDKLFWETLDLKGPMNGSEAVFAHNNMAAMLVMVNAIDLSRDHFQRINRCVSEIPLGYFGAFKDPMQMLDYWRKRCGLPAIRS